jgi:hypothetical protein
MRRRLVRSAVLAVALGLLVAVGFRIEQYFTAET